MADGTAGQAIAPAQGGSILTSDVPEAPASAPAPAPGTAEAAIKEVQDGPPEWAPTKFWDPDKKDVRKEDLGKAYKNLEQLLGRDKVPIPKGDDDEEGWQRWYAASGRPEAADKYDFKRPEKLPEGLPYDDDLEKSYREAAYASGLNKRQAANLYERFVKQQVDRHSAWDTGRKQERSKIEADLMREHGAQYQGFVGSAKSAISQYTDPDFRAWLDETGLGNDPRMIRVFGRIGKDLSGDTSLKGKPTPQVNAADAKKAIENFRDQNKASLFDKDHPNHDRDVKELRRLYEVAHPEQAAG